MSGHIDNGKHVSLCRNLQPAFALLLRAFEYAEDANCDLWEFAVEIGSLRKLGLSEIDFRWLVRKGYIEHAREMTLPGDQERHFRPEGKPVFCNRTCFVLTNDGISNARFVTVDHSLSNDENSDLVEVNGSIVQESTPHWDEEVRELRLGGMVVKRYKWQAVNQQLVLSTFQEEDWCTRIDDPLPPQPEQDSKRRLSDTIKCLNRNQQNSLIRFRGDGTGEGVIWELASGCAEGNG